MSNQPQQPYDPYGQQAPQGHPYDPNAVGYGQDPYPQQAYGGQQAPQGQAAPAQTWQGETWESQSHPTIDPSQGPYGGQQGYPAQGYGAQPSGRYPAPSPYEETAMMPPTPAAGPPPPPSAPGRPAPSPYEETAMMPQAKRGATPPGPPPPPYGGQGHPAPPPSPYEQTAFVPPTAPGPGPVPPPSPYEETALIPPVEAGSGPVSHGGGGGAVPPPSPYEETALIPPVTGAGPMPEARERDGGHRAPAGTGSHRAPAGTGNHRAPAGTGSHRAPGAESPAEDGPAYGPATVTGNTRITDAQRARAEGRSPIIDPGTQPALLTAALGLLMAGGAALGWFGLLVPLVVLQGVTAAGWFRLNGMWPARQGIVLAFAGALVADAVLLVAGEENGPAAVIGTLGVWVLLCLVLQLRSGAPPDDRLHGLFATIASAALAILAAGYLAAGADAVVVGGISVAVAVFVRSLPLPAAASMVAAVLAGAGAGAVGGALTGLGAPAALIGAGAAVCAVIGHRVAAYDYPSRFVHMTAGVALPLTAAAPAVYLLGRVVTG
ncbi:hypothetical protein [Streptomyces sp. BBFR102]|uniref:hypothetical protein n=1 Tax=Streptomyces sp. BBFR102 TaxID=3448171 RepID=UPI003F534C6A